MKVYKTRTKKLIVIICGLAFLLMVALFVASVPLSVKADTDGKLAFNLINNGTEYDVCIYDKSQTRIIIPETFNGLPVTKIANNGFAACTNLQTIVIPNSVRSIGNNAFLNDKKLETVIMPNVEDVGTNAFAMCSGIMQFVIRDSVETIGATAFRGFTNAATIYVEAENPKSGWSANCFASCNAAVLYGTYTPVDLNLEEMTRDGVDGYRIINKEIVNPGAEIIISSDYTPDNKPILEIDALAFTGCDVDAIIVEDSEHTINVLSYAFNSCNANSIDLGNNVTYYDEYGASLDPITGASISDSVFATNTATLISTAFDHNIIPQGMFSYTDNLNVLKLNNDANAIPTGISVIDEDAFRSSFSISKLTIPSTITKVEQNAFAEWGAKRTQVLDFDLLEIPDEWRQQCGDAIVRTKKTTVSFETYSDNELQDEEISRYTEDYTFPIPIKMGYSFDGWYSAGGADAYGDGSGTGIQIADEKGTLKTSLINYNDFTLYAKWTIINYSIEYVISFGFVSGERPATFNVKTNIVLGTVTHLDYVFIGWYFNENGSGQKIEAITPGLFAENLKLYAVYQGRVSVSIVNTDGQFLAYCYYDNGVGIPVDEQSYTNLAIGSKIQIPYDGMRNGYNVQWTDGENCYNLGAEYTVTKDAVIRPVFTEKTLTECLVGGTYRIYTANQLQGLATIDTTNKIFELYDNISVGTWTPIETFKGSLRGSGYSITINQIDSGNGNRVGFIRTNSGNISDIDITANLTVNYRADYVGLLAGYNTASAVVNYCITRGNINSYAEYTGGVVGCNAGNLHSDIKNYVSITAFGHTGGVAGYNAETGLLGMRTYNYGAINFQYSAITNVVNKVGGITGRATGTIYLVYNYGTISYVGGNSMDTIVAGRTYAPTISPVFGSYEAGDASSIYYKTGCVNSGGLKNISWKIGLIMHTFSQTQNVQYANSGTL